MATLKNLTIKENGSLKSEKAFNIKLLNYIKNTDITAKIFEMFMNFGGGKNLSDIQTNKNMYIRNFYVKDTLNIVNGKEVEKKYLDGEKVPYKIENFNKIQLKFEDWTSETIAINEDDLAAVGMKGLNVGKAKDIADEVLQKSSAAYLNTIIEASKAIYKGTKIDGKDFAADKSRVVLVTEADLLAKAKIDGIIMNNIKTQLNVKAIRDNLITKDLTVRDFVTIGTADVAAALALNKVELPSINEGLDLISGKLKISRFNNGQLFIEVPNSYFSEPDVKCITMAYNTLPGLSPDQRQVRFIKWFKEGTESSHLARGVTQSFYRSPIVAEKFDNKFINPYTFFILTTKAIPFIGSKKKKEDEDNVSNS